MTEPPFPLGESARRRWDELAPLQDGRRPWSDDLAAYCAAWGRWVDAESVLSGEGASVVTITDDKGNVKSIGPAPEIKISADALKLVRELGPRLRLPK